MKETIQLAMSGDANRLVGFVATSRDFNDVNDANVLANSLPKSVKAKVVQYNTNRDENGNPVFECATVTVEGSLMSNTRAGIANETSINRLMSLINNKNVNIELVNMFDTINELVVALNSKTKNAA